MCVCVCTQTVLQPDGSNVITFSNGTRKIIDPDGKSSSVYFFNGDVKHVNSDETVVRMSLHM